MASDGSLLRRAGPVHVRESGRLAAAWALRRRQGPAAAAREEETARRVAAADLAAWKRTVLAAGPALRRLRGLTPGARAWLLAAYAAGELCAYLHDVRGTLLDAVRDTDDDARAELLDGAIEELEVADAHVARDRAAWFFGGRSRAGVRAAFDLLDRAAALARRRPLVDGTERDRVLRQILRVVAH